MDESIDLDSAEEQAYAWIDAKNGVVDCASYVESLSRPTAGEYMVMPNGTVEFVRV